MRLSAIDCVTRGVSNLRANWELVLIQLVQAVACSVIALIGLIIVAVAVGASALFKLSDGLDWQRLFTELERLGELSTSWGLLAIVLAGVMILAALLGLTYSWFQAGTFLTLMGGERQAPPQPGIDWRSFRTFSARSFGGWASQGCWRLFAFKGLVSLVAFVFFSLMLALAVVLVTWSAVDLDSVGSLVAGCLLLLPIIPIVVLLYIWSTLGSALLARPEIGVLSAARLALAFLGRRFGTCLLIVLLFLGANFGLGLVFSVLSQGMALVLAQSVGATVSVQILLAIAQSLVSSLAAIAFFAAVVALVRDELDARAD